MGLRRSITLVAAVCLIGTASQTASAAPQVLALLTSDQPIPLACNDSECSALVGTFCLQRDRDIPVYGQPYEANLPERLTLSLIDTNGAVRQIEAAGADLHFSGYSGYSMVRASLRRAELDRLGGTAAALQIGPGISLVPQARTGDRNPQTPEEIAMATGPMRIAAAPYIDQPTVSGDAARLVAALINGLPESRTIHDNYDGLWDQTIGNGSRQQSNPAALRQAERAYQTCVESDFNSLRQCLLSQHRQMLVPENRKFWDDSAGY